MKKSSKKLQNSEKIEFASIAERLALALTALGYRHVSEFIEATGTNKSTVYAILSGKTKDPGSRILEKCYYAGINLNWLITGEEEMLVSQSKRVSVASDQAKRGVKLYDTLEASGNLEERIRDTMDDMLGMYQRLKKLREYAAELEKLDPKQEKLFHNLVQAFLNSSKSGS